MARFMMRCLDDSPAMRAALAGLLSLGLALLLGRRSIVWLARHFREPNASDSERLRRLHAHKESTPTMGGLFIVAGLGIASLALADCTNRCVQLTLLAVVGLTLVGAIDDLTKIMRGRGLRPRVKLLAQTAVALAVAVPLYRLQSADPEHLPLAIPGLDGSVALGAWFVPWAALVVVGAANAVNLTDGLDGLAAGCLTFAFAALAAVTCVSGAGELAVVAAAAAGVVLGFLWFNRHPAQVFMGDAGALPLGGLLAMLALCVRQEWILLVVGGVFVVEAASVIVQVASYKWRAKRVFLCAPLHHHFQFLGWPEKRIVLRFWLAAALCAALGLASLGWNAGETAPQLASPASGALTHVRR